MSNANSSLTIKVGTSGVAATIADINKIAGAVKGYLSFITAEFNPSAIFQSVAAVAKFGDELQRLHYQTGDSIKSLTAIEEAMVRIGENAESAAPLISKMQRSIAEAVSPIGSSDTKTYTRMFSALGLDPVALSKLGVQKQLLTIADALNAVHNDAQRADIAMQIFGRSGAHILQLFRDPRAMEILRGGGGTFGDVMQRNAESLHNLTGTIREIGELFPLKFFAGVADLLPVQEITESLNHALDAVDITGFGQKFGALVTVIINSWKDGKFPEMVGLLIEAGFELGFDAVKGLWRVQMAQLQLLTSEGFLKGLLNAIMEFGVSAAKFLIKVLTEPIIYMAAGFDWLGSHIKSVFTDSINFFIKEWNKTIAKIPGFKIQFAPIENSGASTFSESLNDMRKFTEPLSKSATDYLTDTLRQSQAILGLNEKLSANDDTHASALSRLNALINEQITLRKSAKTESQSAESEIVQAFDTREFLAKQELSLNQDLLRVKQQLAQIEGDFTKTNAQKYALKKASLNSEIGYYQTAIGQNNALINSGSIGPDDKLELAKTNERLYGGLANAQDSLAKLGPDPHSFSAQFDATITQLKNKFGTFAQATAATFADVFNGAINSISKGITGLIEGTMRWGQALREIGTSILDSIIQAIVKMFVTWILQMTVLALLQKLFNQQGNQQAAQSAAAWGPAAVAASIASYGAAAAVGTASAIAGMALGAAFAGALSGGAGGYAEGGFTGAGGKYDVAGIVHRGEYVMPATAVNRIGVPTLEAIRQGDNGAPVAVGSPDVHVHMWDDKSRMVAFMRDDPDAQHVIVDTLSKNINRFTA